MNYLEKGVDIDDFLSALEVACRMLVAVKDEPSHKIEERGAKI